MLIKTNNRWDAAKALHNTLLKDTRRYCNACDTDYIGETCCENMEVGTHLAFVSGIKKQNEELSKIRINEYGATKDKSMRFGISVPPRFLRDMERGFQTLYGESLFRKGREKKDLHAFMKTFPHFRVCDKV